MAPDLAVGAEIAGYRIERVLARGGMGVLYVAEDIALGRKVALKVIAPELADDGAFRDRFIRESQLAASIDHPNVIPIHRAGEENGVLFLAMRLVDGTDLRTVIDRDGQLGVERAVSAVTQVAAALDAAHARDLVHRDVKPANILVATGGGAEHVYLSDFGLTKGRQGDRSITRTGQFLGTADYAAPEQFEGKPLDGRADLYSLGCVLFECLTGEPPFPRDQEVASMYAHLREPRPAASDRRPGLPREVDAVVKKAMARNPDDRFQSGADLSAALGGALGSVPGRARPVGAQGRRRTMAIGAGIVAAVVAVVAGALAISRDSGGSGGGQPASPSAPQSITIPVDSVARFDPRTLRRVATASTGVWPDVLVASGAYLYTMNRGDQTLTQIDAATSKTVATRGGVTDPCPLLSPNPAGGVWVSGCGERGQITLMSEDPFERVKTFTMPKRLFGASVVVAGGVLWVCTNDDKRQPDVVLKLDARTGKVLQRVTVGDSPTFLQPANGGLWATNEFDGTLSKIDPATGQVQTFEGFTGPGTMVVRGLRELWIEDYGENAIYRFDTVRGSVTGVVQDVRGVLALTEDALWALETDEDVLVRIDPETTEVVARYDVPNATGIAAAAGSLWISAGIDQS